LLYKIVFQNDLVTAIKNDTETKLFLYKKSDIDAVKEQIPKLKAIKGTTRMHELIGRKNGQLYGKDISSDKERLLKVNF
jgi:hypothetical protein